MPYKKQKEPVTDEPRPNKRRKTDETKRKTPARSFVLPTFKPEIILRYGENPYQDDPLAWQFGETVSVFVTRLSPLVDNIPEDGAIKVANPLRRVHDRDEDEAWAVERGRAILGRYDPAMHRRTAKEGSKKSEVARLVAADVKRLEERLEGEADIQGLLHGKWIVPVDEDRVDELWRLVAAKTLEDKLGCAAWLTHADESGQYLLHIFTPNFKDRSSVGAALAKIWHYALAGPDVKLYYKLHFYSLLGLRSGNQWHIHTGRYSTDNFKKLRKECHEQGVDSSP